MDEPARPGGHSCKAFAGQGVSSPKGIILDAKATRQAKGRFLMSSLTSSIGLEWSRRSFVIRIASAIYRVFLYRTEMARLGQSRTARFARVINRGGSAPS